MKINIILPSFGESGGIDVINRYAKILLKRGHDVRVYKSIYQPNLNRYEFRLKNSIHRVYCTLKTILLMDSNEYTQFVPKISDKYIRNADVTIATAWFTAYWVNELSKEKGKKIYLVQDFEVWDNKELGVGSYRLPLKKIVISSWIEDKIRGVTGEKKFIKLINGVDSDFFVDANISDCRKERINCLMLNHILPKKGIDYGLKAFELARKQCPNLKLTMFGMNDSDNLPSYVEYYKNPSRDLLKNLYRKSDIFIFPSIDEGWGLTPVEAMASRCAVVASDTGFVKDLGVDRENILISDPKDYEKMSENIVELVQNKQLFLHLSNCGYDTVKELKWNECAEKLEDILLNEVKK